MSFLPRRELLSLEELDRLCTVFVERLGAAPAVARHMSMTGG
jgi:molybdenum cofactor biosynthesis enzyme MoaA